MKKIFLISLLVVSMAGCNMNDSRRGTSTVGCNTNDRKKATTKKDLLADVNDSDLANSLIFWASDTACSENPELLMLLDTLYQYVRGETFPSSAEQDEKWMSEYRQRLCHYYDTHEMGSDILNDIISASAKAEAVLDEGTRLIELDEDWSTMGAMVKLDTEYAFDVLREYGLLSQLLRQCGSSAETKEIIYREWDLYSELSEKMMSVSAGVTTMQFWHGSIVGPTVARERLSISHSRREMIQTIMNIIEGNSWDGKGVYLKNAQQLLIDCSRKAVNDIVAEQKASSDSPFMSEDDYNRFMEVAKDTEEAIDELNPLLDKWIVLWEEIDEELTERWSRHGMERAASYVLIMWASIVSSR